MLFDFYQTLTGYVTKYNRNFHFHQLEVIFIAFVVRKGND